MVIQKNVEYKIYRTTTITALFNNHYIIIMLRLKLENVRYGHKKYMLLNLNL